MDIQDVSTHSIEEPYSKEIAKNGIPQVSMLSRPPLPPSLQKINIAKSFLGELEAETLSKESLEDSSDSSVLDPDDNLLEALADNETLTAVLTSFFANISETKGKVKEEFVLKNCIDEETIRCGDAHQGNRLVPGHKTLTSPFTESTEELRKAALHGDILAQWRLSQRVENTVSLGACRQDIENSLTSMATNEPPENHLFTNLNHSARPLQSWGSAYLPPRKRGSSIRCQQSSSSAYRGFVPTYSSQQMLRSKQKLKSLCSQFDLTSRLTTTPPKAIQSAVLQQNCYALDQPNQITPQKISLREAEIQCCPLVSNKLSGPAQASLSKNLVTKLPKRSVGVQSQTPRLQSSRGSQTNPPYKHCIGRCIAVQCNIPFLSSLTASSQLASPGPYDPWIFSEVDCLPISERWERSLMTLPMPTSTPHSSFTLVSSLPPSPEYPKSNTRNQSPSHSPVYKDCPAYKEHLHRDAILTDLKAARSMCARKLELVEEVLQRKCVKPLVQRLPHP